MKDKIARAKIEEIKVNIKRLDERRLSELQSINNELSELYTKVILLKAEIKNNADKVGIPSAPPFLMPIKGYSLYTLISLILKHLKLEIRHTPEDLRLVKKVAKDE
jgi:hypothetical protein